MLIFGRAWSKILALPGWPASSNIALLQVPTSPEYYAYFIDITTFDLRSPVPKLASCSLDILAGGGDSSNNAAVVAWAVVGGVCAAGE